MQLNPITARRLVASLLASVAVFVVAAPAQADPDTYRGVAASGSDAFTRYVQNEQYRADRIGIPNSVVPYLSQGIVEPEQAWDVVPYLSQGVGITRMAPALLYAHEPEYLGLSDIVANDRAHFSLHSDRTDTRTGQGVAGRSSGFDWETAGIAAGTAGLAVLLAASAMLASRRQRRLQGA